MKKKSVSTNYIYNLIYQIFVIILPIITTPYLSRILGANGIGIYSYTTSIITYFTLIGSLGIAIYGQRELAKYQDNKEKLSKTFFSLFVLRTITLGISCLLFFIIFCFDNEYSIYYRILVLEILATIMDVSWLYQGIEDFKKITLRNLVIKTLSIILIFTLVKHESDLLIYMVIYILTNLIGNGSLWININKYIDFKYIKSIKIKDYIKPAITMLIPQIASSIYTVLDKTMIGTLCNDISEVGYYEQAQKIVKISLTVITSLNTVLVPKIAKNFYDGKIEQVNKYMSKTFNFIWFLSIPMALGIIAISSKFVPWFFGDGYEKVIVLLRATTPLILFIAFSTAIGSQYLMSIDKQNIHTRSVIIGAIINTITNFLLIPKFMSIGAIIASLLAEGTIATIETVYIIKKQGINYLTIVNHCWNYIIAGVLMFVITWIIGERLEATMLTTLIQILIGSIIYGLVLIILKDKFLIESFQKITSKIRKKVNKEYILK